MCPRCVFTQLWIGRETCFCEPWNWDLKVKTVFSPMKTWQLHLQTCQKSTLVSFSPHYNDNFGQAFALNKNGCLPLHPWKSSESTVSCNLGNNKHGIQHSQQHFLDLFSHGMVECVLGVSLQSLKPLVNMFLWTWQLWFNDKTVIFSSESWIFAASHCQKNTLVSFFSLLQQKICQISELSVRNRLLACQILWQYNFT